MFCSRSSCNQNNQPYRQESNATLAPVVIALPGWTDPPPLKPIGPAEAENSLGRSRLNAGCFRLNETRHSPVNPTFFLQLRHLFFFFFPSFWPSESCPDGEAMGVSSQPAAAAKSDDEASASDLWNNGNNLVNTLQKHKDSKSEQITK